MSTNTLGILIIIAFIIIGVASGGGIFTPYNPTETDTPWQEELALQKQEAEYSYSDDYFFEDARVNKVNRPSNGSRAQRNVARDINSISQQVDELSQSVAEYVENQNASVYKDRVKIRSVRNPESFREYVSLSTNLDPGEQVLITGWKLRSLVTGSEIIIGGASNNGIVGLREEKPIILSRNARVTISQDRSPIGTSFRVNKCSGYLEQKKNFFPALSTFACPAPIEDAPGLSRAFDNDCLDYIEGLPVCEEPRERDIPKDLSSACENYIKTEINYESCIIDHRNDIDFHLPEWRVYAGRPRILWLEKRDKIQLTDNFGRVVDTIDY